MELIKTEHSHSKGKGKLDKVLLKCEEPNYYELINLLYVSNNNQTLILLALHERKINIVLKFGILESIQKEFQTSNKLLTLPNFIRYFCVIICNDDIKNIVNNSKSISNYKMCHYGKNNIGILVMKYYNLKSIENYNWNSDNFHILKNIIKQVFFAILYAHDMFGFIHNDLHCGNVLLKPKRNLEIKYNKKILVLDELEAVIMDFEKSKFKTISNNNNNIKNLIFGLSKFITSIEYGNNIGLNFDYDRNKLNNLKSIFNENINYYDQIEKILDDIVISK